MSLPTYSQAFAGCSARALRAGTSSLRSLSSSASVSAPPGGPSSPGQRTPQDRHAVQSPSAGAQHGLPVLSGGSTGAHRGPEKHFYKGRTYTPRDLNLEEIYKPGGRRFAPRMGPPHDLAVKSDVFHMLKLKPNKPSLHDDSYKNPILLSEYVSSMGKIMPRSQTQLTKTSQKAIGKAIRRARAMGLMPMINKNSRTWNQMRAPGSNGK